MKKILFFIFLIFLNTAYADEISEKIKTGMSKVEVSHVMGAEPISEDCTSVIGLSKCTLIWRTGFLSKTEYTVTTVADKVVSVAVKTVKILGL